MTDPAPSSAEPAKGAEPSKDPEPLQFYRSFTVGPDFPAKLAAASFRYLVVSPVGLARVLALAIAIAVSAFVITFQKNGVPYAIGLAVIGFVGLVALMAIITGLGFVTERRRFARRIPPGSEFAVGFRSETLLMMSPMDTAEVAFAKYQTCEESGGFVVLRQRQSRILNFLPAECFTPESLAHLREKIGPPSKR